MDKDRLRFIPDNLILSDKDIAAKITIPVYDLQKYGPCHPNEEVFSTLAQVTYQDNPTDLPPGWILLTTASNENDGYFGATYYNSSNNQLVIAHRGTENWESYAADIEGVVWNTKYTSQISSAITFSFFLMSKLKESDRRVYLSLTGHSLGAWLAQITTFALKYLRVQGNNYKPLSENDGYHAHTVVFDSPGCCQMLKKISKDYYFRYENNAEKLIDALDITNYLYCVNIVNSCNEHIGTIFKIHPKCEKFSDVSWYQHCLEQLVLSTRNHSIRHFVDFFKDSRCRDNIKEVLDWPSFIYPEHQKTKCDSSFYNLIKNVCHLAKDNLKGVDKREFKMFFYFAKEMDNYNPNLTDEVNYEERSIKLRYRAIPRAENRKKTSIFTVKELTFLENWNDLRKQGIHFPELSSFLKVENYTEFLPDFEIKGDEIVCNSKENLEKIINLTKLLFLFYSEIYEITKKKIAECSTIFEAKYRAKSEDYRLRLEKDFGGNIHFKDTIQLREFLKSKDQNIWYLFSEKTSLEALRIHKLVKDMTGDDVTEFTDKNCSTFLNVNQLLKLNEYVNVVEIFKSKRSKVDNFFVVECDEINKESIIIIQKFTQVQLETKKIIFIVKNKFKKYFWAFPDENQKELTLSFCDFDEHSQELFLEKEFMVLGNQKINLEHLFKINGLRNLSEALSNVIQDVFDVETITKVITEDNTINLTTDDQLENNLEVSIISIQKDIKPDVLREFIRQKEMKICKKDTILFITGMKNDNDTSEFLNYLTADKEDFVNKITQLIDTKRLILKKTATHHSSSKYYRGLCCEHPKELIYWLRLNYDQENTIKVFEAFDSDLYVKREFCCRRIVRKDRISDVVRSLNDSCCLIFYNVNDIEFQEKITNSNRNGVIFAQYEDEANKLFERERFNKSVHLLKAIDDGNTFEWKKFSGSLEPIHKFAQFDNLIFLNEENFLNSKERLKIISDEPGMGKSTVLNSVMSKLTRNSLAIRINLKDVKYEEIPDKNEDEEIFKFLMRMSSNSEIGLFAKLFKKGFSSNCLPVFIFFDAFDEIQENIHLHVRNKIIDLLKYLKKTTVAKIVITTRKYECKRLESELSALAVEFKDITKEDQLEYLKRFWLPQILMELNTCNQDYESALEFYIRKLLEKMNFTLGKEFSQWMGIPLQMKMLAQIYSPTVNILEESHEELKNSFNKIRNVFDLYHEFFKKKIDRYYNEKKNCHNLPINDRETLITSYYFHHVVLSFDAIFPAGDASLVDSKPLSNEEKKNINQIGVFQISADENVYSIHMTFPEYFVAYKLADWFRNGGDIFMSNRNAIRSIFFGEKCKIIRKFLDNADLSCKNITYFSHLFKIIPEMSLSGIEEANKLNQPSLQRSILLRLLGEKCSKALFQFFFEVFKYGKFVKTYFKIKDVCQLSILHIASSEGYNDIVHSLIESKANVNEQTEKKQTSLHLAAWKGHNDVVKSLIGAGANVNVKDENNRTSLHWAAREGHNDIVKSLIEAGGNVNEKDEYNETSLHLAAREGHNDVVKSLIEAGANVNEKDQNNATSLHRAASKGHNDVVQSLIEAGVNVDEKDKKNRTSLHFAAQKGHNDVVKTLIEAGANVSENNILKQASLYSAALEGHNDLVKSLIEAGANVNEKNIYSKTPLHLAARNGHSDVVKSLIEAGANTNEKDEKNRTSLQLAAREGHNDVVKSLIGAGANVNEKNKHNQTALHLATGNGHSDVVKSLIEAGANVNEKNIYSKTPLHLVAGNGHSDVVKSLIEAGANTNEKDENNRTSLQLVAREGHNDVVQSLIDAGANVDEKDKDNATSLHRAASKGHNDVVKSLIGAGANVNEKNKHNQTALHLAAGNGHNVVVQSLIEAGGNVNEKDEYNETSLHLAAREGHNDVVKTLTEAGANVNEKNIYSKTPLHLATGNGRSDVVKSLIEAGANVNEIDENNRTSLHWAASEGHNDVVKSLTEAGANTNEKDQDNATSLHWAAGNGHNNVVKTLIEAGANVNEKDQDNATSLHWAALEGHNDVVKSLIGAGANVNEKNKHNQTGLYLAAWKGHNNVVKTLIEAGANVNEKDQDNATSLHRAASKGHNDVVKTLIEAGANVNEKDEKNRTSLHWAAQEGHNDVVKTLTEAGADVNQKDQDNATSLHWAALEGHNDVVKTLIEAGANVNEKDEKNRTSLHFAAWKSNNVVVQSLIEAGGNVNEKDEYNETSLHLAAREGHNDVVKTLIEAGANVNEKDEKNRTSLHWAAQECHNDVVKTLIEAGANVNEKDKYN